MLWALAEPWLQGCDYLLVTGGVCTLSPHSWQGSGEQERQRIALRWQGNCGALIHLLLSFPVCVCSVFLAAFCTPPAAEAIPALGTPQLPFPLHRQSEGCCWSSPLPPQSFGTPTSADLILACCF